MVQDPEKRESLSSADHLLYALLRGKDWRKGFTLPSSRKKVENGALIGDGPGIKQAIKFLGFRNRRIINGPPFATYSGLFADLLKPCAVCEALGLMIQPGYSTEALPQWAYNETCVARYVAEKLEAEEAVKSAIRDESAGDANL